jgi:hypothetical protein
MANTSVIAHLVTGLSSIKKTFCNSFSYAIEQFFICSSMFCNILFLGTHSVLYNVQFPAIEKLVRVSRQRIRPLSCGSQQPEIHAQEKINSNISNALHRLLPSSTAPPLRLLPLVAKTLAVASAPPPSFSRPIYRRISVC